MRLGGAVAAIALFVSCADSPAPPPMSPSPATPAAPTPAATARYRVRFEATWSPATHPSVFPGDPHFSDLIGATHELGFRLWREGSIASNGMESMAERGAKTPFDHEIELAIARGRAEHLLSGGGIARSPGVVVLDFDISTHKPAVTLVSMIAPSPDWFVGVSDLSLLEGGVWIDELVIVLDPYDAGTDSGRSYAAPDRDTSPRGPIAHITTPPLASSGTAPPMGTFTFRRQ